MTETDLMNAVMLAASAKDCVIFRTNVGKVRMTDGRWFDTGLPKGHADLYGVSRIPPTHVIPKVNRPDL